MINENKILISLLSLYIFSLGFQSSLDLPFVGHRVQVPEFVFLGIIIFSIYRFKDFTVKFDKVDFVIIIYLISNLISSYWNGSAISSYLEILGKCYLFGVYFIFKLVTIDWDVKRLKEYIIHNFYLLGIVSSVIAIGGWIVATSMQENNIVAYLYENYPYFGSIFRIRGVTPTPSMFAILLSSSAFFMTVLILENESKRKRDFVSLSLVLIACFLTFSKTFLLIIFGIGLLFLRKRGWFKYKFLEPVLIFSLVTLFSVTSHFLFFRSDSDWNAKLESTPFSTNNVLYKNDQIIVLESFYVFSKKCAIEVTKKNPILGVGSGNFNQSLEELDIEKFPALHKLMGVDPHSVYFGTLAENGIVGLICIGLIFYFFISKLKGLIHFEEPNFIYALFMIFTLILIEGITTDVMNFRNLWVIMGIVGGIRVKENS